uniref:Uncharacterized protein n=1 Tax=Arundo donax TaxID=35708 RepID=A0A0A9ERE6_ARUDO
MRLHRTVQIQQYRHISWPPIHLYGIELPGPNVLLQNNSRNSRLFHYMKKYNQLQMMQNNVIQQLSI